MASPTDSGIVGAWRSLSGTNADEGWRLIEIDRAGDATVMAGRRFPDNAEALVVGFPGARVPAGRQLPEGRGFEVVRIDKTEGIEDGTRIALVREPAGALELFGAMAEDIIGALRRARGAAPQFLCDLFLRRVAAWQEFMSRSADRRLSTEQEIGLFGELTLLDEMMNAGVPAVEAVEGWEGPADGLQDFVLGMGAIEVKSSIATTGFPARIGSLEQLDDAVRQPLYLAAQRLALAGDGTTLPELVSRVRLRLADTGAGGTFDLRMRQAGYLADHEADYVRRFSNAGLRLFLVDDGFPRLTVASVSSAIRHAVYGLEVDQVEAAPLTLAHALQSLEII